MRGRRTETVSAAEKEESEAFPGKGGRTGKRRGGNSNFGLKGKEEGECSTKRNCVSISSFGKRGGLKVYLRKEGRLPSREGGDLQIIGKKKREQLQPGPQHLSTD